MCICKTISHFVTLNILPIADQLLDMGFRPDIEKILKLLEPSKSRRQTLLFSATVPGTVSEIANIALKPNYSFIDTVGVEVEQTHMHVKQELVVAPQAQQVYAIEALLAKETPKDKPFKVIVFFTTARLTGFMADLFNSVKSDLGYSTFEIHSRMSQPARQKASDAFRNSTRAVLFSSDVSARGMDYPDVTYVLQVGLTERAQYIHRLGRTARAGKEGKGCLLVAPYEEKWMVKQLEDMPLQKVAFPPVAKPCMDTALNMVGRDKELKVSAEQAYRAWLGFYNGNTKKCNWDKVQLVETANQWAKDVGLREQPTIEKKTVGKMGLKGVRGLKLE
jgi:ATP-dependent RNA helicase MSS116, mitochondrial